MRVTYCIVVDAMIEELCTLLFKHPALVHIEVQHSGAGLYKKKKVAESSACFNVRELCVCVVRQEFWVDAFEPLQIESVLHMHAHMYIRV